MLSNPNLTALLDEVARTSANTTEHGSWFEYISDYALKNHPEYGPQIKTIEQYTTWARRELPNASPSQWRDLGVDRVVTTHAGRFWAIQNKGYAARAKSSYTDFTNFLAQSDGIPNVEKRIWVTSGAGLDEQASGVNKDQQRGVIVHNRSWLAAMPQDFYPETLADLRLALEEGVVVPPEAALPLRLHQEIAVTAILRGLDTNPGVQFISACGTGKTVTTHALHAALGSQMTAFFVPTLGLMRQTIAAWRRQASWRFTAIAVCSDDSMFTKKGDEDHLVISAQEFGQHLIDGPAELAERIAAAADLTYTDDSGITRPLPVVVFSTYHSAHVLVEAQHRHGAPTFDLAVADEAHYLAGRGEFGELVKEKPDKRDRLRAVKRVYATATPKCVDPALASKHGIDSLNPDSPIFGPQAHVLTFGEAIQLNILSPYRLSIVVVPDELLALVEGDVNVDGVSARYLAAAYAIKRAAENGERKFISYHSLVRDAKIFARLLIDTEITSHADTIWGDLNAHTRETAITKFEATTEPAILTNVRCLNEGVDIPSLDTVIFTDPKSQVVDIAQSVGRVLRRHPGKTIGHIIVPIPMSASALADGSTIDEVSALMRKDPRWKTAFNVVEAMGQHDKTLQQNIEVIVRAGVTGRKIPTSGGGQIIIDFITDGGDTSSPALSHEDLDQSLFLAVYREVAGTWAERYGKVADWLVEHSGVYPSSKKGNATAERTLAGWVSSQVSAQRHGDLSDERRAYLGELTGWFERSATSDQLNERDLSDYVDWAQANGSFPKADDENADGRYLAGRRPILIKFWETFGGDWDDLVGAEGDQ